VFYDSLREPGVSRAQALQRAQLALLRERAYRHPFFWTPFVVINSWL
jgi:CHAT domain-containing protein